jgi:hypothetical protein
MGEREPPRRPQIPHSTRGTSRLNILLPSDQAKKTFAVKICKAEVLRKPRRALQRGESEGDFSEDASSSLKEAVVLATLTPSSPRRA